MVSGKLVVKKNSVVVLVFPLVVDSVKLVEVFKVSKFSVVDWKTVVVDSIGVRSESKIR